MSNLKYRPDIDGLRALAVMFVIFYHAGLPYVTGGYVGVDVFFVISGFLITSLVLKDLKEGKFSLAGFWERRARRILPAYVVMAIATLAAGWFLFLPDDYAALGKEVVAQSVFGSNMLFYKEAGYFDRESALKPLLHTWSLAVEEQFYLLFPPFMLLVWKKCRNHMALSLVGGTIMSFVLCQIVMHNKSLAFYMLPFRAWELSLGSILAYAATGSTGRENGLLKNLAGAAGLLAILLAVFYFDDKTRFPGIAALLPCVGAALFIWAGLDRPSLFNRCLAVRPVVFVGLISYSLYLWHWPLIVFAKYNILNVFTSETAAMTVGLTFILAFISWRFVERPFRSRTIFPDRKQLFFAAFVCLLLLGVMGLGLFYTKGFPARMDPAIVKFAAGADDTNPYRSCDKKSLKDINADKVCETLPDKNVKPDFILWGDSQADAIAPAFFELSKKYNRNGFILTHHGCESIIGFTKASWDKGYDCEEFNYAVHDLIKRHDIKNVFLVSAWNSWMSQETDNPGQTILRKVSAKTYHNNIATGLAATLDILRGEGRKIYLMEEVPDVPFDPARYPAMMLLKGLSAPERGAIKKDYVATRGSQTDVFLKDYGRQKIQVLDPADILCDGISCQYQDNGYPLYYNPSHLSAHGALYMAPLFEPYFKSVNSKP